MFPNKPTYHEFKENFIQNYYQPCTLQTANTPLGIHETNFSHFGTSVCAANVSNLDWFTNKVFIMGEKLNSTVINSQFTVRDRPLPAESNYILNRLCEVLNALNLQIYQPTLKSAYEEIIYNIDESDTNMYDHRKNEFFNPNYMEPIIVNDEENEVICQQDPEV